MTSDTHFAGSIPSVYEDCLVPILFDPFADDLVARALSLAPTKVLELAAGTGVVSFKLAAALPNSRIVATDLNPGMLAVASGRVRPSNLSFEPADAQSLPFASGSFDLIVAQFGAMFFPDKIGAYREARRVLTSGGSLLFNVWDSLEANSGSEAIHQAVRRAVPEPKPDFIARTPFGYNEPRQIEQELRAAGFDEVTIERVERHSPCGSAVRLARGMCLGSPLANELAVHSPELCEHALGAAIAAAERAEASAPLSMSALVIAAR
ncbi:MAG: class I SAM-dependent methyltransferase [Croceibacterium sp.]